MKFITKIFGCQMNYTDAARVKAILQNIGRELVSTEEEAEVIIFVTCSIKQKAEDKITGFIKQIDKNKKIWITGCMPQHYLRTNRILETFSKKKLPDLLRVGNFIDSFSNIEYRKNNINDYKVIGIKSNDWEEINKSDKNQIKNGNISNNTKKISCPNNEELENVGNKQQKLIPINNAFNPFFSKLNKTYPNLELIFRIDDTGLLPIILEKISKKDFFYNKNSEIIHDEYTDIIPKATTMIGNSKSMNQKNIKNKTAFVPISTGCSQFCHYCIVPFARGFERHFSKEKILKEVKTYLDQGVEEITLLGQIVNKHPEFVEILKDIFSLKSNLKWLRYTSPYPTYYNDDLLKLHETEKRLCPHIHIPVQSGSNKILKKMNRGYTIEEFKKTIDKIKGLKRKINITTDIIVGYTDENKEDFQKSLDLVEYCNFTQVYIGKYSVRPGTYAAKNLEDNIPKEVKEYRYMKLDKHFREIAKKENKKEIGRKTIMLITMIKDGVIKGYIDNIKNIMIEKTPKKDFFVGDFLNVEIIGSKDLILIGKVI